MNLFNRINGARRLAAALLLSTSMSTVVLVQPAAAQTTDERVEAFLSSRFNYCDAKLLGALWGFDPYRGKAEIGYKIMNNLEGNLEGLFQQARNNGVTCTWEDTGLTPADARVLAQVWETNPRQARETAAGYYTHGSSGTVRNALGR